MFDRDELLNWSCKLNLSQEALILIERIRLANPFRQVKSGKGNVTGKYPSKKMGFTIQFESHQNELAFIYEYEHDNAVCEYYDQPNQIKLFYKSKTGKSLGVSHTPDFFVIRENSAGWEECKTEDELIKLAEKSPHRYQINENGQWHCPPGQEYAQRYGFYYKLRSSKEINWKKQRNLLFLEDYLRMDYVVEESIQKKILATICFQEGIALEELFQRIGENISKDNVFSMIVKEKVYIDLEKDLLTEIDKTKIFSCKEKSLIFSQIIETSFNKRTTQSIDISTGSTINWDGCVWKIINHGVENVSLLSINNRFNELPLNTFEALVKSGRIIGTLNSSNVKENTEAIKRLSQATLQDLEEANRRYELVINHLKGRKITSELNVPERTLRYWARLYKNAVEIFDSGYIGLLPRKWARGFRGSKLPEPTLKLMEEFIEKDYENLKQKRKIEVWGTFKLACEKQGIICPSYKTFSKAIASRDQYQQKLKRQGHRASYNSKPFYWVLEQKTPVHGDRPFEICHIDHTQLDVELVCSYTKQNMGRPWATFLTDANSRRILAVFVTFDPPSYRSCMMVIRECVRLHNRFPQVLVVDGGKEFKSIYFDALLARYECTKKIRPPSESRFGSVCERLFGTSNSQFIHNLKGNTQIMQNVRQVTKYVDPKNQAVWTLGKLYEQLCEYAYKVYESNVHPGLSQTPEEAFALGFRNFGSRSQRFITYDRAFFIWTLPTTKKGQAKVQTSKGIKINSIMYWCDAFRNPQLEETWVDVRYDPHNIGIAYAYIGKQWIECFSQYYSKLQGRTEKELMIITNEIRAKNRQHSQQIPITAKRIAEFLSNVETQEKLLAQSFREREASSIYAKINGDFDSHTFLTKEIDSSKLTSSNKGDKLLTEKLDEEEIHEIYEEFL